MNLKRLKHWQPDIELIICENSYNMKSIHKFVLDCFNFKYIDKIVQKKNMFKKYGLYGTIVHDEDLMYIYLDFDQPLEQKFLSSLHEIFHVYFHDYVNWQEEFYDLVETRAEVSAMNMLSWYYTHTKCFSTLKKKVISLTVEDITKEDKELLQE